MDYLLKFHIRGEMVQADTHDEDGFYALNPITGKYSGPIPWPDGLNYDWLCKLQEVARLADLRNAGIRNRVIH
jgi:hypothetical protein